MPSTTKVKRSASIAAPDVSKTSTRIIRASLKARLYRDIEIPGDKSLAVLAEAVVAAFDFDCDHAYGFFSKLTGHIYDSPIRYELFADMEPGEPSKSVKRTKVAQAFPKVGSKLLFLFDYGDEWRFKLDVIASAEKIPGIAYPRIVASVGEAPAQYDLPDDEDD